MSAVMGEIRGLQVRSESSKETSALPPKTSDGVYAFSGDEGLRWVGCYVVPLLFAFGCEPLAPVTLCLAGENTGESFLGAV